MKNQGYGHIPILSHRLEFPPVHSANADGLLAVGGDLSPERLIKAYKSGIFPWYTEHSPILWWSPDPRMVLYPAEIKISKTMRRLIKRKTFSLTMNTCFDQVLEHCSTIYRQGQEGTWITQDMKQAYSKLHQLGHAKSYEVWQDNTLVGGLYGVDLGHVFCGESMFSLVANASKFAFICLAQQLHIKNYVLIDCQMYTDHLASMGAQEIPRADFLTLLTQGKR